MNLRELISFQRYEVSKHRDSPTFKMQNVGTVPLFKMHNIGTVLTFKMHNVRTPILYKKCCSLNCLAKIDDRSLHPFCNFSLLWPISQLSPPSQWGLNQMDKECSVWTIPIAKVYIILTFKELFSWSSSPTFPTNWTCLYRNKGAFNKSS